MGLTVQKLQQAILESHYEILLTNTKNVKNSKI